jgi:hypothetical protein
MTHADSARERFRERFFFFGVIHAQGAESGVTLERLVFWVTWPDR